MDKISKATTTHEHELSFEKNLPDLPRVLNKREAKKTNKTLRELILEKYGSVPCEVKRRGQKLAPHQLSFLKKATTDKGVCYKIPDLGQRNPCDLVCYRNSRAFIAWIEKNGSYTFEEVFGDK